MNITNTTLTDITAIFKLYDAATAYQKTVTKKSWQGFERTLIEREINENRHYKIVEDGDQVACTFVIARNNPVIWEDSGQDQALYLHRIATHPDFRGKGYVKAIVSWAKTYAKANALSYIRMDTHSGNERLNQYYINAGFNYKGIRPIEWTSELPEHYKDGPFSLFEIKL